MTKDLVGKTLGEYRLESVIGEGGLATVYKAYQLSLNRPVAIKVLYHQEGTSLARFEREAKVVAALRHRNILIIYEYGEQEELPYIVMEYVEGGTLEDRLKGKPMEWRQAVNLIIPIAEALHHAHNQGIIHRDIKPSNILMQQEDWPVLADFGLVKQSNEQQGLTVTGTFMGTPNYISPEQARDLPIDHRADMYSLGVVMFEMVAGRLPFNYRVSNKILLAHVMEEPPSPLTFNPNCPPELAEIILKTLRKAPAERYANMQGLIEALKALLYGAAVPEEPQIAETDTPVEPMITPEKPEPIVTPQKPDTEEKPLGRLFNPIRKFFSRETPDTAKLSAEAKAEPEEEGEAGHTLRVGSERSAGRGAPKLVGGAKKITVEFPEGLRLVVGRTHGSTVVDINLDPYEASKYGVSRSHARFFKKDNLWFLEDLHSLNGTFVNEVRLQHGQPVALKNGDTIRFSQMSFTFQVA